MVRWKPGARERLEEAALALYTEQGFESTTVAQIAERAGLTERTYFRHFADKREALFSGQAELLDIWRDALAGAPETASPLDIVATALHTVTDPLAGRREYARRRRAVIAANPGLQEREHLKLAALSAATAEALRDRGIDEPVASLAAEIAIGVFKVAFAQWIDGSHDQELSEVVDECLAGLRTLLRT